MDDAIAGKPTNIVRNFGGPVPCVEYPQIGHDLKCFCVRAAIGIISGSRRREVSNEEDGIAGVGVVVGVEEFGNCDRTVRGQVRLEANLSGICALFSD